MSQTELIETVLREALIEAQRISSALEAIEEILRNASPPLPAKSRKGGAK